MLHFLPLIDILGPKPEPDEANYGWIFMLIPLVLALVYFFFNKHLQTKWEKGIFPPNLKINKDNLLEAYICLGARMIQADPKEAGEKIKYMDKYFTKQFGDHAYDFSDSLRYSYQHPIQVDTVAYWLKINLPYNKRLQVLYFLVGMALMDRFMDGKEMKILAEMRDIMEVSQKDFQSIIAMYKQQEQRYYQQQSEKRKEKPMSGYKKKSAIKLSSEILGVSEHASMDEVKKAYRRLVKLHHPDRFATESPEQQKIAEERFIEIQKAYEVLEKYK